MKLSDLTFTERASVYTIAAKNVGMDYGKYVFLLGCGMAKLPPLEEIMAQMVIKKKRSTNEPRAVVQYSMKGEYIATFVNAGDATAALGRDRRTSHNINHACNGSARSAFGYQWRYEGDNPPGIYARLSGEIPVRIAKRVDKVCVLCGAAYKGAGRSLYCSKKCADIAKAESGKRYYEKHKHYPEERLVMCKHCGKQFTTVHGRAVFCSDRCRNASTMAAYKARKLAQNRKAVCNE